MFYEEDKSWIQVGHKNKNHEVRLTQSNEKRFQLSFDYGNQLSYTETKGKAQKYGMANDGKLKQRMLVDSLMTR